MMRIGEDDYGKLPTELRKWNFIDCSNLLQRPLWEKKLLRFLHVQDDSSDQDEEEKQAEYSNANINHFS